MSVTRRRLEHSFSPPRFCQRVLRCPRVVAAMILLRLMFQHLPVRGCATPLLGHVTSLAELRPLAQKAAVTVFVL